MTNNESEWTFSLVVPNDSPEQSARTVHLSSFSAAAATCSSSEPPHDVPETEQVEVPIPETTSLLSSAEQDDDDSSKNDGGWKFSGPEWSLSSKMLLQLTFSPAWQALPEYTNMSAARDYCQRSIPSTCRSSCHSSRRSVDMYCQTYTTQHIFKVQQFDNLRIRGLGVCRGVQVFLKYRKCKALDESLIPTQELRDALKRQQELDKHCTNEWDKHVDEPDSLPPPPWTRDNNTTTSTLYGPILTFAMPIDDSNGPPLLWKVQVPPSPNMAVETYTVLDGSLYPNEHSPTHIYINGYQSWSFSGSVVQGDLQPKSAMPNVFSRAFNFGGYPAPSATHDEEWDDLPPPQKYKADFFACITSDASARVPPRKFPYRLLDDASATIRQQERANKFPYRLLDETGGPALLLGWLSQHEEFGVVTADETLHHVKMHASSGPNILCRGGQTDWSYAQLVASHNYDEEPMVHFLHAVAAYNEARPLQNGPLLTGWCSWYHYYENIDAGSLRDNFNKLYALQKTVPTNVSVVDDGYMTAWGDWDSLKPGKFPQAGMKGVANDIKSFGMRPGIWLAPFACDKHSQVAKQHPDWIIWNNQGRPANSSNCGKFFYGLDATNPHVREYVYSCVKRAVHEWGFNVLKIDFLYAACLEGNGKYDLSMTRAEAMHLALRTIRTAAGPDVFLIGCGCPIGSGIGYADGMRVSADTGPTWYPAFPLPWWDNGTLPALRAMTRNSMSRAILGHRWWHNDPDCLLLGETTRLTDIEVASAASIVAMTCGMLLLSDDLTQVSPSRMKILTKIFPMTGATAVVLDLHNTNDGLPSLMRLWCTDRYYEEVALSTAASTTTISTLLGRQASFTPDEPLPHPSERKRNCIHVTSGLGTWTLLSISNWLDEAAVVHIPSVAIDAPPTSGWDGDNEDDNDESVSSKAPYGYHVFGFWSSNYAWMPAAPRDKNGDGPQPSLSKRLEAHETEIFHLRAVTPNVPQYIGSDIHFSCGQEVQTFVVKETLVKVLLRSNHERQGHVFLYIPRHDISKVQVSVGGVSTPFQVVGNTPGGSDNTTCIGRILCIPVAVHGDDTKLDGQVIVEF